jgi:hypothetical protein
MWGMSWRQEAMKGVANCDKLGEVVKRTLIPRFPNDRGLDAKLRVNRDEARLSVVASRH